MNRPVKVFGTLAYSKLANSVAEQGGFTRGSFEQKEFPDGERYYRLMDDIEDQDAVLIAGTISDRDTLELYDLGWKLAESGARSLTLIIPFFGYSTMERVVHQGEVVMAKSRAHLLSSIPEAGAGNRIVLLDLHSEGLPYYFDGHVRPVHLYAKQIVMRAAVALGGKDFVLASTDAGRAKWVESLANEMGVDAAFIYKRRLDGERTQVAGINANVEGRRVIIYDDMIRTGSSLIQAARAYRNAGATETFAITTHGLFPQNSLSKIRESGVLSKIICTDSHPRALDLQSDFLQVHSISELLVDFLKLAHH